MNYTDNISWTPERGSFYGNYENHHFSIALDIDNQTLLVSGHEDVLTPTYHVINEFNGEYTTIAECIHRINEYFHATKQS